MTAVAQQTGLQSTPKWELIVSGGIAVLVGAFLLLSPAVSLTLLIPGLGILLIVGGLLTGVDAVIHRGSSWGWRVAVGALLLLGGVFALAEPQAAGIITLVTLYFCFAFVLTALGLFELYNGFRAPRSWMLVTVGIVQLVLALVLLMNPLFGVALVVPMIGLTALLLGVGLIVAVVWQPDWLFSPA